MALQFKFKTNRTSRKSKERFSRPTDRIEAFMSSGRLADFANELTEGKQDSDEELKEFNDKDNIYKADLIINNKNKDDRINRRETLTIVNHNVRSLAN